MKPFVDTHRRRLGVERICKVLQVAPSAYWREAASERDPTLEPARRQRNATLASQIEAVFTNNMNVYGADKVWRQLKREGTQVARCRVERLMRKQGLRGVIRGKSVRTTRLDPKQPFPKDLVHRQFRADRPNQLWVSDFTYVWTWQGFVYVAFVIDVFARRIVGWRVSASMHTDFALDALQQALYARQGERNGVGEANAKLIHHSDRGTQYVSIRYGLRLAEVGINPSVGSKGDSYDNALAETINGLYKAELIHRRGPWKTREAVELATLEWVSWFNSIRYWSRWATSRLPKLKPGIGQHRRSGKNQGYNRLKRSCIHERRHRQARHARGGLRPGACGGVI
jgi:putative transposase